jgi:hypothetical protein
MHILSHKRRSVDDHVVHFSNHLSVTGKTKKTLSAGLPSIASRHSSHLTKRITSSCFFDDFRPVLAILWVWIS